MAPTCNRIFPDSNHPSVGWFLFYCELTDDEAGAAEDEFAEEDADTLEDAPVPDDVAAVELLEYETLSRIEPECCVQVFLSFFLYQPTAVDGQALVASNPVVVQ